MQKDQRGYLCYQRVTRPRSKPLTAPLTPIRVFVPIPWRIWMPQYPPIHSSHCHMRYQGSPDRRIEKAGNVPDLAGVELEAAKNSAYACLGA